MSLHYWHNNYVIWGEVWFVKGSVSRTCKRTCMLRLSTGTSQASLCSFPALQPSVNGSELRIFLPSYLSSTYMVCIHGCANSGFYTYKVQCINIGRRQNWHKGIFFLQLSLILKLAYTYFPSSLISSSFVNK